MKNTEVKQNNRSYHSILSSARELFWKHGVRRVTVEEICREAGVSKMTFYRMFKNKNEAALAVLNDVIGENLQKYRAIMNRDISFREKMEQVIGLKFEGTIDISREFIEDIYRHEELGLKKRLSEYQQSFMGEVMQDFSEAQKEGWIREDVKPEFILYILNRLNDMMEDEHLLSLYGSMQQAIMELTNFFFYGVLSDKR